MSRLPVQNRNGFSVTRYNKPINMLSKARGAQEMIRRMPRWAAELAHAHALANFEAEGFIDKGGVQRWPSKRKGVTGPGSKKLLVDTGRMKNSIKILSAGPRVARIGSNVRYSGVHNRSVGEMKKYPQGVYPGRKYLGHSSELVDVTVQMIVGRLNLAMRR